MLTDDCADLPDDLLEPACNTWRTSKPFLPRANALRESVKAMVVTIIRSGRTWAERCDDANAKKRQTMMTLEPGEANRQEAFWWDVVGAGDGTGMQLKYTAQAAA